MPLKHEVEGSIPSGGTMIENLRIGMTRDEMFSSCGQPTDIGRGTRKYPTPCVYRYGRIEVAFGPTAKDGLVYVMDIGESGEEHNFILRS